MVKTEKINIQTKDLKTFPLLKTLDGELLNKIIKEVRCIKARDGEIILSENEKLKEGSLYFIAEGEVSIIKLGFVISTLSVGSYFGEMAVLSEKPRSATVKTNTDSLLYVIDKDIFDKYLRPDEGVMVNIAITMEERIRKLNDAIVMQLYRVVKMTNTLEENMFQFMNANKYVSMGELTGSIMNGLKSSANLVCKNVDDMEEYVSEAKIKDEKIAGFLKRQKIAADKIISAADRFRDCMKNKDPEIERMNMHKVLEDTNELLENIFKKENIIISMRLDAADYFIRGNFGKLQQTIISILINARDAIKMVEGISKGQIKISTLNENDFLIVDIFDNGCGIEEKIIDRVFDSFFTTKADMDRPGLALSIAKSTLEEINGSIFIRKEDRGTTVSLKIPVSEVMC